MSHYSLSLLELIFGPKKLPELGKGIGEGIHGFKTAVRPTENPVETVKEMDANRVL
jgi:sec-independent protein translocase protein TatA